MVNDMAFENFPDELIVPGDAITGQARIVITQTIPPELAGNNYVSIILFMSPVDNTYGFIAVDNAGNMDEGYVQGGVPAYDVSFQGGGANGGVTQADTIWQSPLDGSGAGVFGIGQWQNQFSSPGITYANAWNDSDGTGNTDPRLQIKRMPMDQSVWLYGRILSPNPFNATVGSVDSNALWPRTNAFIPAQRNAATGLGLRLNISPSGVITASGDNTVSVAWWVNGIYSLDA
jgi:hypothetical protein